MWRNTILIGLVIILLFTGGSVLAQASAETPAVLPSLDAGIVIRDWHCIGPFSSGPRESMVNPLESFYHPLDSSGIPDLSARYPSILATGRDVGWTEIQADENGNLNFKFDNVDWDKINDEWGVSGINFSGAAYAEFNCGMKCRALADASGIGTFVLNGVRYSGDPYGHHLIKPPVILEEGVNHISFFFGGFGGEDSVQFKLEPVPGEVMILDRDILVPDVVRGELTQGFIGVPILNTTEQWLEGASLSIESDYLSFQEDVDVPSIAPLSVVKMCVGLRNTDNFPSEYENDELEINIMVKHPYGETSAMATVRVRNPEDSRIITFRSRIDNSTQKLAVRYPLDYDPSKEYALILTTHGAGVECEGQVDAFQPKDWAFVAAATNRRRFGFDWQDWGRLDALEVLNYCKWQYPIDDNRVYLVGHSMGGHGAWHIGTTHADQFAAVVPSAGWASFQLYIPWFLRSDEMFADPDLKRIIDACNSPDRTELLLPNLRNTPVLAVHGSEDDNVPPTHARLLTGMLERMGYQAAYWEEPGQGHWWDETPDIPGADCVDAERIINFLKNNVRDEFPQHVTFVSYDLGNNSGSYWVSVSEALRPMGKIQVDAEINAGSSITATTYNVKRLSFDLSHMSSVKLPAQIIIDGQEVAMPHMIDTAVTLIRGDKGWYVTNYIPTGRMKRDNCRGPIKRAYYQPFVIVVGTTGTKEQNDLNMELARDLAQRWWYRANGHVLIVTDTDAMVGSKWWGYNYILIGGPSSNSYSEAASSYLPIQMSDSGVWLGDEFIPGKDLAVKFIFPEPLLGQRLILCNWGTSVEGMRLAAGLTCLYSGSGLPDFLVFDKDVKLMGMAGVKAAGFFDNDWKLDADLYYLCRN